MFFLIIFKKPQGIYFVLVRVGLVDLRDEKHVFWYSTMSLLRTSLGNFKFRYIKLLLAHSAVIRIIVLQICNSFVAHTTLTIASSFFLHNTGLAFFSPMLFSFSNTSFLLGPPWITYKCYMNN